MCSIFNVNGCNKMFDSIIADVYNIIRYNSEQLDKYHIKKSNPLSNRILFTNYISEKSRKCCKIM